MLKIKLPDAFNFDGAKFGAHFFVDFNPNVPDPRFWIDTNRVLYCPSLPDQVIDLADFEADTSPATKVMFPLPIHAPDFIVATPKVNDDPDQALDEAITEMEKGAGNPKSIALIVLSITRWAKANKGKIKKLK